MTAATLTAPLDVLKTRLQSDIYHKQLQSAASTGLKTGNPISVAVFHVRETLQILWTVRRTEGTRALFKGLGPNLVGVVPARSINFYTYGNGKRLIANYFNAGRESAWVHLSAAVLAGIVTSTATNPIWLVKTRLQLDKNVAEQSGGQTARQYRNSLDCVRQVLRNEGVRGLYKGMSASYLGVSESSIQWVLYEQIKSAFRRRDQRIALAGRTKTVWDRTVDWTGHMFAAGGAKLFASIITYPHEVGLSLSVSRALRVVTDAAPRPGRPHPPPPGAHGRRPPQVLGPGPVLPHHLDRGGPRRSLRRPDATPAADRPVGRHHVRHLRGHPASARHQVLNTATVGLLLPCLTALLSLSPASPPNLPLRCPCNNKGNVIYSDDCGI